MSNTRCNKTIKKIINHKELRPTNRCIVQLEYNTTRLYDGYDNDLFNGVYKNDIHSTQLCLGLAKGTVIVAWKNEWKDIRNVGCDIVLDVYLMKYPNLRKYCN